MSRRNSKLVATIGLVGSVLLLAVAFHLGDLPLVSPAKTTYAADFTDAGGLRPGDPVQVAGVNVGRVTQIDIDADKVVVEFEVNSKIALHDDTRAAIQVSSLLGQKYLDVIPQGEGSLAKGATIPLDRTTPAYDVVAAFQDLTKVTEKIDTHQLATALDTISGAFAHSGPQVRSALRGLSRFSSVIASRDQALHALVGHARNVSGVLDQRRTDIVALVRSANLLLGELEKRRAAVHSLLLDTTSLARQLRGVVTDNASTLTPALRQLASVTKLLVQHQGQLRAVIRNSENYISTFNNVVGNGPWFDVVIPRLPNSVRQGN